MTWHGKFRAFVCNKLSVFNWDNIDNQLPKTGLSQKMQNNPLKYQEILFAEEKKSRYIAANWLDAIADGRTEKEAYNLFFELLQEYSPCSSLEEKKMNYGIPEKRIDLINLLKHSFF